MVDLKEGTAKQVSTVGAHSRAAAARVVHRVRDRGQSLTRALQEQHGGETSRDPALTQEMSYGTLRLLPRLEAIAALLLKHPLKKADRDLECLILVGLYQLEAMATPPHAAVSATVGAVRLLGKPGKAGLVNALLRRFLREQDRLRQAVSQQTEARWLFPKWLIEHLQRNWPQDWESILTVSNERPPMALRVNGTRIDRSSYAARLAQAGITARPIRDLETGLMLDTPRPARELPGFEEGLVAIQDSGAQLAANLLDAETDQRALDACAAPGGKTAAILERAHNRLDLVAIDKDDTRLESVRALLTRLGLDAHIIQDDATSPREAWRDTPFDRILLDAPCSATGVIRRHPDIKWLRRPDDIAALCATQRQMLDALWPLLATGGRLLYATCSLLAEENQEQIADFLARREDARELTLRTDWGRSLTHGRQLLPTSGGHDGFYYALLEKRTP
ncbi:16S rRNA (cytosine(967)-C(5))-methyltransferase RsmB [Thiorhodococcus mannitoliphagus]|uniref:16S rRNA (cytosine(967)-C(5))-methyltransferase n=1 Tax=Thiorhodococcus mannitoliphagus TaxID=329406 RepID=A0A6P1DUD1_9GAMM|nr:16S rRNA (cytosine(967)-C(5))-methyltransferase RsmB [Thiorhodococcus mannitoliphagus]NEX19652.1 16S rRNA (cytosine(967)-C(5))-methyltransferase RsmB [Thiorhodococcus mannitoliphagus]